MDNSGKVGDYTSSAFPSTHHELIPTSSGGYPSGRVFTTSGLSKRELFAAMAMNAHFFLNRHNDELISAENVAKDAVACADALLKELSKEKSE